MTVGALDDCPTVCSRDVVIVADKNLHDVAEVISNTKNKRFSSFKN